MASVVRKTFSVSGTRLPRAASTPSEKAMSVAAGIAQPLSVAGSLQLMRDVDQRRHGHAARAQRTTGRAICEGCDSAPSTTSRLISSPTSRKNTAIRPSLIHSRTGLFSTIGPSEKPKRIRSRSSTALAKGELASTRAAMAATSSGIADAASLSMNSLSRLRSANLASPHSRTPGPFRARASR